MLSPLIWLVHPNLSNRQVNPLFPSYDSFEGVVFHAIAFCRCNSLHQTHVILVLTIVSLITIAIYGSRLRHSLASAMMLSPTASSLNLMEAQFPKVSVIIPAYRTHLTSYGA